jgi:hypothetical protein
MCVRRKEKKVKEKTLLIHSNQTTTVVLSAQRVSNWFLFFSWFFFITILVTFEGREREKALFFSYSFTHSFICSTLAETTCRERREREQHRNVKLKKRNCGYE